VCYVFRPGRSSQPWRIAVVASSVRDRTPVLTKIRLICASTDFDVIPSVRPIWSVIETVGFGAAGIVGLLIAFPILERRRQLDLGGGRYWIRTSDFTDVNRAL
jgi:hypothetical protein